jgi:hypothetical protein
MPRYVPQSQVARAAWQSREFSSTLVAYFTLLPLRTEKPVKIVCLFFRVWTGYNNSQTDGAEKEKLEKGQ